MGLVQHSLELVPVFLDEPEAGPMEEGVWILTRVDACGCPKQAVVLLVQFLFPAGRSSLLFLLPLFDIVFSNELGSYCMSILLSRPLKYLLVFLPPQLGLFDVSPVLADRLLYFIQILVSLRIDLPAGIGRLPMMINGPDRLSIVCII